jgi:hypothetical protein
MNHVVPRAVIWIFDGSRDIEISPISGTSYPISENPISGTTRYRVQPDIGYNPISSTTREHASRCRVAPGRRINVASGLATLMRLPDRLARLGPARRPVNAVFQLRYGPLAILNMLRQQESQDRPGKGRIRYIHYIRHDWS